MDEVSHKQSLSIQNDAGGGKRAKLAGHLCVEGWSLAA
jgi:hypothetical protein